MVITKYTEQARQAIAAYRNYIRRGYSRRTARALTQLMIADARACVYPLRAY